MYSVFEPTPLSKWRGHLIPVALCKKLGMDGRRRSKPIISIINENNNSDSNNNDIPLNSFQHQFLKWRWRKMFTSTAAFRLQDLCRKVRQFLCGRPRDNEIVSITARVRNDGSLNWNLAAIYIIGLFIKVRCLSGERWLDKQDFLKALLVAGARRNPVSLPDMTRDTTTFYCLLPWISAILIFHRTKKHKLRAQDQTVS